MGERWYDRECHLLPGRRDVRRTPTGMASATFKVSSAGSTICTGSGSTVCGCNPIHPTPGRTTGTTSPTSTTSIRGWAPSATSPSCCTRRRTGASRSSSTWWSTTRPTSTRGSSRRVLVAGLALPRLVRLGRHGALRPLPGHGLPRRADRDVDLPPQRPGLVLPPLLRLPAGPEHRQPGGARRDQEDHGLLAAARRRRVPDGRGAVHHRADRAGRPELARRTSTFLTELRAARVLAARRRGAARRGQRRRRTSSRSTSATRAARATASTCSSTSCSTTRWCSRWPGRAPSR